VKIKDEKWSPNAPISRIDNKHTQNSPRARRHSPRSPLISRSFFDESEISGYYENKLVVYIGARARRVIWQAWWDWLFETLAIEDHDASLEERKGENEKAGKSSPSSTFRKPGDLLVFESLCGASRPVLRNFSGTFFERHWEILVLHAALGTNRWYQEVVKEESSSRWLDLVRQLEGLDGPDVFYNGRVLRKEDMRMWGAGRGLGVQTVENTSKTKFGNLQVFHRPFSAIFQFEDSGEVIIFSRKDRRSLERLIKSNATVKVRKEKKTRLYVRGLDGHTVDVDVISKKKKKKKDIKSGTFRRVVGKELSKSMEIQAPFENAPVKEGWYVRRTMRTDTGKSLVDEADQYLPFKFYEKPLASNAQFHIEHTREKVGRKRNWMKTMDGRFMRRYTLKDAKLEGENHQWNLDLSSFKSVSDFVSEGLLKQIHERKGEEVAISDVIEGLQGKRDERYKKSIEKEKVLSSMFWWEVYQNDQLSLDDLKEHLRQFEPRLHEQLFLNLRHRQELGEMYERLQNLQTVHGAWWFMFWMSMRTLYGMAAPDPLSPLSPVRRITRDRTTISNLLKPINAVRCTARRGRSMKMRDEGEEMKETVELSAEKILTRLDEMKAYDTLRCFWKAYTMDDKCKFYAEDGTEPVANEIPKEIQRELDNLEKELASIVEDFQRGIQGSKSIANLPDQAKDTVSLVAAITRNIGSISSTSSFAKRFREGKKESTSVSEKKIVRGTTIVEEINDDSLIIPRFPTEEKDRDNGVQDVQSPRYDDSFLEDISTDEEDEIDPDWVKGKNDVGGGWFCIRSKPEVNPLPSSVVPEKKNVKPLSDTAIDEEKPISLERSKECEIKASKKKKRRPQMSYKQQQELQSALKYRMWLSKKSNRKGIWKYSVGDLVLVKRMNQKNPLNGLVTALIEKPETKLNPSKKKRKNSPPQLSRFVRVIFLGLTKTHGRVISENFPESSEQLSLDPIHEKKEQRAYSECAQRIRDLQTPGSIVASLPRRVSVLVKPGFNGENNEDLRYPTVELLPFHERKFRDSSPERRSSSTIRPVKITLAPITADGKDKDDVKDPSPTGTRDSLHPGLDGNSPLRNSNAQMFRTRAAPILPIMRHKRSDRKLRFGATGAMRPMVRAISDNVQILSREGQLGSFYVHPHAEMPKGEINQRKIVRTMSTPAIQRYALYRKTIDDKETVAKQKRNSEILMQDWNYWKESIKDYSSKWNVISIEELCRLIESVGRTLPTDRSIEILQKYWELFEPDKDWIGKSRAILKFRGHNDIVDTKKSLELLQFYGSADHITARQAAKVFKASFRVSRSRLSKKLGEWTGKVILGEVHEISWEELLKAIKICRGDVVYEYMSPLAPVQDLVGRFPRNFDEKSLVYDQKY